MKQFVWKVCALVFLISSCSRQPEFPRLTSSDSLVVVQENVTHREEVEQFMREGEGSPFLRDTTVKFTGLQWFPVDVRYRGISKLHRYDSPETVIVMGTQGEARKQLRYGFFEFVVPDDSGKPFLLKLNAYKFTPYDGRRFELFPNSLSVWFTDATTGKETYHVGRYVDVGDENPDSDYEYVIDLNKAYNPYCAYSDLYSCAIPRKEDRVEVAVRAGERMYGKESSER